MKITINYGTAFRARVVLAGELKRITAILADAKKTFGGFAPIPGSVEYWTKRFNEETTALADLDRAMIEDTHVSDAEDDDVISLDEDLIAVAAYSLQQREQVILLHDQMAERGLYEQDRDTETILQLERAMERPKEKA